MNDCVCEAENIAVGWDGVEWDEEYKIVGWDGMVWYCMKNTKLWGGMTSE